MADTETGRWIWIVAGAVAVAVIAATVVVEQVTGQRGMTTFGLLVAGAVFVFVYAMSTIVAQNACEACGIGNPPGATTCWKCDAPLDPVTSGHQQDYDDAEQDEDADEQRE